MPRLKKIVIQGLEPLFNLISRLLSNSRLWYPASRGVLNEARVRTKIVAHNGATLRFHVPNDRCLFRADSFLTKEPETLRWIDGFQDNTVFWDIGACVGTYTIYAALTKNARVVAVEPSIFNLEWLARNVHSNNVESNVTIVPLALTSEPQMADFKMQVLEWGGALSSFGVDYDHEGLSFQSRFVYPTIGANGSFLIDSFNLPEPKHLKIDVDSIEHLVLLGLLPHLSEVKSIALENSRNVEVVRSCADLLEKIGFAVKESGRANTIWER